MLLLIPDPWVNHGVRDINEEIYYHVNQREDQHHAGDDWEIIIENGVDSETAQARPGENRFGDHRAGNVGRDQEPGKG